MRAMGRSSHCLLRWTALCLVLTRVASFVPFSVDPTARWRTLCQARRKSSDIYDKNNDDSDASENTSAKRAALEGVLNQIERSYGRGSVMRLGQAEHLQVATISTGSLTLDAATGGGYPRGRVVEIYGPESSGKTTLALHAIAEVQKQGGTAAFIDAEHALDPAYAQGCGVNVDDLLVSQPDSGEMALDVVRSATVLLPNTIVLLCAAGAVVGFNTPHRTSHSQLTMFLFRSINWCVPPPWTSLLWIPSPPWYPAPNSKETCPI